MRRNVWLAVVAGALAVAVVAAACGTEEEPLKISPQAGAASPEATGTAEGRPGGIYGGPTEEADGAAATPTTGPAVLTVSQSNFFFDPAEFTVESGATITVENTGTASHTFTIADQGIDIVNQPGGSQDVVIDAPPGTYRFVCRFHESSGMVGTITVSG